MDFATGPAPEPSALSPSLSHESAGGLYLSARCQRARPLPALDPYVVLSLAPSPTKIAARNFRQYRFLCVAVPLVSQNLVVHCLQVDSL